MDSRMTAVATFAVIAGALAGCGGEAKSPTNCPDGTVLKGSDCVPDDAASAGDDSSSGSPASSSKQNDDKSASGASGGGANGGGASGSGDSPASGGSAAYDKDAVEVQLKRAARQVKGNCGGATDDSGQATGPWGQTKASVVLGRNGRVKRITVPAPYDGKPVGVCIEHAFQKLVFPPYAGSSDAIVDWDVELVPPKK